MAAGGSATSLEAAVDARLSTLREQAPLWEAQPFTIFRVPAYLRESNRTAYEPRMVSIGPYYHGKPELRAMEDHKWRYLYGLLNRNRVDSSALVQEMRSLEARARACYSERPADELGSDDLVRMLLLDGCFIIEFFHKWYYKEKDALCDVGWGITLVTADLLLLENQIPFFVLERLYHLVTRGQGTRQNLVDLLIEYISTEILVACPSATCEIHHLLHLYYESFVPKRPTDASQHSSQSAASPPRSQNAASPPQSLQYGAASPPQSQGAASTPQSLRYGAASPPQSQGAASTPQLPSAALPQKLKMIPRAAEMSAAGVTFVRRISARDMYDVKFDGRRGVMEIPGVEIDDMRRPLLVNLIAFEQSQGAEEAGVVTSYVSLMSMLVRTVQDVELLRHRGVLDNLLADDEEAARFFSRLGDSGGAMDYDRQVFSGLYDDVRRYCGSPWHRNRAVLKRDYFANPWSAISLVVAAFVVFLTATQTYFSVFPRK